MLESLDRFVREYQDYNGITDQRAARQLRGLRDLCSFAQVSDPLNVNSTQYREWLQMLRHERKLAPPTVVQYGMFVRPFFGWAFDSGLYSGDELMAIKRTQFPTCKKRVPRPYSAKEIKRIWPAIAKRYPRDDESQYLRRYFKGTSRFRKVQAQANHLQLTAIVRIALDGGLRMSEIFDLDIDDMHYDNAYIVVREGKGDKFREVPYTSVARAAVKDWIEFRTRLKCGHDRVWLSLSTRVNPLAPMNKRRFECYVRDLGNWELHRLRHTCATNWLRAGMSLEKLSRLLGHSNISMTLSYAELVPDDIQKNVERHEDKFQEQLA